jgi:hypothetical protein
MELLYEVATGNIKGQLTLGERKERCRQHDIKCGHWLKSDVTWHNNFVWLTAGRHSDMCSIPACNQ